MSKLTGVMISPTEYELLSGAPHLAFRLYYTLAMRRDFDTGKVGARYPNIAWEALAQECTVESHPGIQRDKPSRDQMRRAGAWLVRRGLVVMQSNEDQRQLIFFLRVAHRIFLSLKKPPISRQTKPPVRSHRQNRAEAARPDNGKAATHQDSDYNYYRGGSYSGSSNEIPVDNLIVSGSLNPTEKAEVLDLIRRGHVNGQAQAILDELAGAIEKGAIRSTSQAFVVGCIKRAKAGAFNPDKGKAIVARRAKQAQDQRTAAAPPPAQPEPSRSRRRPDMGALREFLPDYRKE